MERTAHWKGKWSLGRLKDVTTTYHLPGEVQPSNKGFKTQTRVIRYYEKIYALRLTG